MPQYSPLISYLCSPMKNPEVIYTLYRPSEKIICRGVAECHSGHSISARQLQFDENQDCGSTRGKHILLLQLERLERSQCGSTFKDKQILLQTRNRDNNLFRDRFSFVYLVQLGSEIFLRKQCASSRII